MNRLIDTIVVHDEGLAWTIAGLLETKAADGVKYEITMQSKGNSLERMDGRNETVLSIYEKCDLK